MTRPLLGLLVILLAAPALWAQGGARMTAEQEAELIREVGGPDAWKSLPEWRQRTLRQRYARFLKKPAKEQARIRRKGLRGYLIHPGKRPGLRALPEPVRKELARVPESVRSDVAKLAAMRLRQLRLDRHLSLVPFEKRREVFRSLFPEPFDPGPARAARKDLEHRVARAFAERLRTRLEQEERARGAPYDKEKRLRRARALVKESTREEEQRLVSRVVRDLRRFADTDTDPERARRLLEKGGVSALERMQLYITPRQGELIRWALFPLECPLIKPDFMGPRPTDPAARRDWERDFRTLARLDLLCEAGLPKEMVLHLAGSGSPEEFFRAVRALRGHPEKR